MGISGTQTALMQARSGVMRSDASRSGYYSFRYRFYVNGSDRTSQVELPASITLGLNDTPTTFTVRVRSDASFTPAIGQTAIIAYGSSDNYECAGQIASIELAPRTVRAQKAQIQLTCVDWRNLLDRRSVNQKWLNASATMIAQDIINGYTSGFTDGGVELGLSNIPTFEATNARPSDLLRQLAGLIGGGFYVDPRRVVHLFSSTGERRTGSATTINSSHPALTSFGHRKDFTQYRNRVICEGRSTRLMISLPSGYNWGTSFSIVPIEDSFGFKPSSGTCRIGPYRFSYTELHRTGAKDGDNAKGTQVRTAAAAGATTIDVDSVQFLEDQSALYGGQVTYFVKIGDQVIQSTGYSYSGTPSTNAILNSIPASGFGSISTPIPVDAEVTPLATIVISAQYVPNVVPIDSPVVLYEVAEDTVGQAALAAVEGGDGIHEHVIAEGTLDADGAYAYAAADLALFSDTDGIIEAQWVTRDLGVTIGAYQSIALSSAPDSLTASLTVTNITETLDTPTKRPTKSVTASNSKQAALLDVVKVK